MRRLYTILTVVLAALLIVVLVLPPQTYFTQVSTSTVKIKDSSGNNIQAATDPCFGLALKHNGVHITSGTAVLLVGKVAGKTTTICKATITNASAMQERIIIINGTQMTNPCDTGTAQVFGGSTTASAGQALAANAGGISGDVNWPDTGTNLDTCAQIANVGSDTNVDVSYVQQ